jgi:hypothetical protein
MVIPRRKVGTEPGLQAVWHPRRKQRKSPRSHGGPTAHRRSSFEQKENNVNATAKENQFRHRYSFSFSFMHHPMIAQTIDQ